MKYEAVEKPRTNDDHPCDWEIRIEGASKGSGKIATVWGRYGFDAGETARTIVGALNGRKA